MRKTTKNYRIQRLIFGLFVLFIWLGMMYYSRDVFPVDGDMKRAQLSWWNYLSVHGMQGVVTIGKDIDADYTSIWYVIIALFGKLHLYPNLPVQYCIKMMAGFFTLLSSIAAFYIVKQFSAKDSWKPVITAALFLFLPAFFLDVIKTNLPDSSYIALVLFSLLAFIKKKNWLAWLILGAALPFKMMGIYFAPFLFFFYLRDFKENFLHKKWLEIVSPLFGIVGFLLLSFPGILAGQSFSDATIGTLLSRSAVGGLNYGFWDLLNAGKNWNWMPNIQMEQVADMAKFGYLAMILSFVILYSLLFNIKSIERQDELSLNLLVLSPLICWLFMPAQHEGYFALATVFSVILFIIKPCRKNLIIALLLNFILIEANHGFYRVLGSASSYEYLIVGIAVYQFYLVFRESEVFEHLKKE
ncbi:MAG: hypothetical protein LBV19_01100 [Streptococcaceae bacterium]|jgi:Gpi18-like mannosyltransferase|nr:hypothetical protein [Streptococcaceae bacterium]